MNTAAAVITALHWPAGSQQAQHVNNDGAQCLHPIVNGADLQHTLKHQ